MFDDHENKYGDDNMIVDDDDDGVCLRKWRWTPWRRLPSSTS